jgi:hypothetical protein
MDFTLRLGRPEDADHLIAFDHLARVDRRRADLIQGKLQDAACWVADLLAIVEKLTCKRRGAEISSVALFLGKNYESCCGHIFQHEIMGFLERLERVKD